jgi:hypothetical protein
VLDQGRHATFVGGWLERSAKDLSPAALLRLFRTAFGALWTRTKTTLGEVTLIAIAERVLHDASGKFPFLSALEIEANSGLQFRELDERIGSVDGVELRDGIRFVLTEFLTVLGHLTAEILTPELHAELSHVALPEAARGEGEASDGDIERTDRGAKGKKS